MDIYNSEQELEFERDQIFYDEGMYEPFVYIIRFIEQNKFYIGMRVARGCLRTDLGSKYFTSSKIVEPLWKDDLGNVEVLETIPCNTNWDTIYLEGKMIVDHDAVNDKRYLNRAYGGVLFNNSGGVASDETKAKRSNSLKRRIFSDEARAKMSETHKGKTLSDETRAKMSESRFGKNNPNWGKFHSNESKAKISKANKGRHLGDKHHYWGKRLSDEHRAKISETKKGKTLSEEHRANISESGKGRYKSAYGYRWEYA